MMGLYVVIGDAWVFRREVIKGYARATDGCELERGEVIFVFDTVQFKWSGSYTTTNYRVITRKGVFFIGEFTLQDDCEKLTPTC